MNRNYKEVTVSDMHIGRNMFLVLENGSKGFGYVVKNENGSFYSYADYGSMKVISVLEQVDFILPTEEEINKAILARPDLEQTPFMRGIDYILNKLK